jgi:hypothetical protein
MHPRVRNWQSVVLILSGLLLALAVPASAHVERKSGPFRVTMGWGEEPARSGSENFVEVGVSDTSGAPVKARAGTLDVEVSFGQAVITLPLVPGHAPGQFRAVIVPTRPGTYGFHVTGPIKGRNIDAQAMCSASTFDCVTDISEVQFPARDPSTGQLAQRLARALPRAERAEDRADSARGIALGAIGVAGLALAAVIALAVRGRRKHG